MDTNCAKQVVVPLLPVRRSGLVDDEVNAYQQLPIASNGIYMQHKPYYIQTQRADTSAFGVCNQITTRLLIHQYEIRRLDMPVNRGTGSDPGCKGQKKAVSINLCIE